MGGEAARKEENREEDQEESEEEVKPEETVQGVDEGDEDERDEEKESKESVTEEADNHQREGFQGTVVEQSKDEIESNEMKNEGTEHLAHNGEIKEKVDSVAVDDVDDGHLESSNDREINENTDNLDNSSEDSFQGNQIDVPSLEELSAETDEDARADTSEKVVPSVSESVEDAFGVSEQRKEEQETQGRNDRELINLFFIDNQTDDDVLKKSNLRFSDLEKRNHDPDFLIYLLVNCLLDTAFVTLG